MMSVGAYKLGWRYFVTFVHHDGCLTDQAAIPFWTRWGAMSVARSTSAEEGMRRCRLLVYRRFGLRAGYHSRPVAEFREGELVVR